MKQYTTPEQTAKLIELGLPKPRYYCADKYTIIHTGFEINDYSMGELIEMLPTTIIDKIWWGKEKGEDGIWGLRIDTGCTDYGWDISYERDNSAYLYREGRSELIDALYDMVIKLKEEGVI